MIFSIKRGKKTRIIEKHSIGIPHSVFEPQKKVFGLWLDAAPGRLFYNLKDAKEFLDNGDSRIVNIF
jgi:hypothetical protein